METSSDSGITKYPSKDTDNDELADVVDLTSNGTFDLYAIGRADLDLTSFGYIARASDLDEDGIQDPVDTALTDRGAPGSPLSPYATANKTAGKMTPDAAAANDVKVYPNPVKAGESLYIHITKSDIETVYIVYSAQGQLVKSGKFTGNGIVSTSSLVTGVYIVKTQSCKTAKSYKIIVQ